MTLPSTIYIPVKSDDILSGEPEKLDNFFHEYTHIIQEMYEDIAAAVNGNIKNDQSESGNNWVPTLDGSVSGSFTYVNQTGWVKRQGLMVQVWGDIEWSAPVTATGNLFINLPYKVANSAKMPFMGVVQPSNLAFTAGTNCVMNGIPNTLKAEIWNTGTGIPTANQLVVNDGRLIFYLTYIGQRDA